MTAIYADRIKGVASNRAIKAPVAVATTANITLSGAQTIDGVAVVAGDRVLVMAQTDATQNGIYDASATAWTRALDFNGAWDVMRGTQVFVAGGTTYALTTLYIVTANPVVGEAITFAVVNVLGNPGAIQHFSTRAIAMATFINAAIKRITVADNDMILTYERVSGSTAMPSADGAAWGAPVGSFAFLQHWGVTTYSTTAAALAAGAAMTPGERVTEQARITAALGETSGSLVIRGFVEFYDAIIINPARVINLERGMPFDGLVRSSRFNMAAAYGLQLGTVAVGGCNVQSLHIWDDQPTAPANRAALNQYPWAVSIAGITRGTIGNLRISGGWKGVNGVGNCGGWSIDTIEYGCFSEGVRLDGALDFVNIKKLHSWYFGFASNATLQAIYADGVTEAVRLGRMDGLKVDHLAVYKAQVVIDDAVGGLPIIIDTVQLDGDYANLTLARGKTMIGPIYGTEVASAPQLSYKVLVTNGKHTITGADLVGDSTPLLEVTGGELDFTGRLYNTNLTIGQGATVTGGTLRLFDTHAEWPTGARTLAFIEQSGTGVLQISGLTVNAATAGEAVKFNTDVAGNYIDTPGRLAPHTVTIPSGAHLGDYGRNQRADLVVRAAALWRAVPGEMHWADGEAYIGSLGATGLTGLPGLIPATRDVTPDHCGGKNRAAILAAATYVNTLCVTGISSDQPATTAVDLVFRRGLYDCSDGATTAPLVLTTVGSWQRYVWEGARVKGLSIRVNRKHVHILDPFIDGVGFEMDYGIRFEPDTGEAYRGGFVRHPHLINIQKADKTAKAIQCWGDASHIELLGGWYEANDYGIWSKIKANGEAVGGLLATGFQMIAHRKNGMYLGSIGECKPINFRIRSSAEQGLLIEGDVSIKALEQYIQNGSITGNHTDLTTRLSHAITSVTNNGGFARFNLSGLPGRLWNGLRNLRIRDTGVSAYDTATDVRITGMTGAYVDTNLAFVSSATGNFYHCGFDVEIRAATFPNTYDVKITDGNFNSLGLHRCNNITVNGTRVKYNFWASECNSIFWDGMGRGRDEDSNETIGIVGQTTGIFEFGLATPDGAGPTTLATLMMRTPQDKGLTNNEPNAYASVGVNSAGVYIEGPIIAEDFVPAIIARRLKATTTIPFVIAGEGQSNAVGVGTGQSTTINQTGGGIWIYSSLTGGTGGTMVQAAYGTAPLNLAYPTGTTAVAANARANIGVHLANQIRTLGLIPDSRPIWIVVNAVSGINISEWADSPFTRETAFAAALAQMSTIYGSALTVDHMHWQQGEANGTTAGPYNTDATYIGAWDVLYAARKASIYWTTETTITVGEILQSRPFVATDTPFATMRPVNARNTALRTIASGIKNPKIGIVPTDDLVAQGTLTADQNHFNGLGLQTIGERAANRLVAMRVGAAAGAHIASDGRPVLTHPQQTFTSETVYLGHKDIDTGHLFLRLAMATINLPLVESGNNNLIFMDIWSVSGGNTTVNTPTNTTMEGPLGLVSTVSLGIGTYMFWFSGRWQFIALSPQRGDYIKYAPANLAPNEVKGYTQPEAHGLVVNVFGNCFVGLPSPEQGAEITMVMRSITGGTSTIGRACHTALIAAGGTGYVVGDTIVTALGGATGTAPTLTVSTVAAGVITAVTLTAPACITSAAAPTNPVAQATTSGVGTGATFTLTYSTAAILGPRIADSAFSYALTLVDQVVRLEAAGASWRVISDNRASVFFGANDALLLGAGTAALPIYSFAGDPDTGLSNPAANTIGLSAAGAEVVRLIAQGLRIGNFANAIGSLSGAQIGIESAASVNVIMRRNSASTSAPIFYMAKSRGAANGAFDIVNAGDGIGDFRFHAADGAADILSARIQAVVEGTPALGDVRSGLNFYTGQSAGATTLALQINTSGAVLCRGAGGFGFSTGSGSPGTQITSRTTGVTINTPSGNITLVSQAGQTTPQSFTVTNSACGQNDVPIVKQKSGTDIYHVLVSNIATGSFRVTLFTTGGTTVEAPVLNFAIVKGSIT